MEEKKYQIATHNGVFHADEVMAIAIIREVMPNIQVVRTRDPEVISKSLIAVDVGGVYNDGVMQFDHHQREGAGERGENEIPYSSCGLVWKRFGAEICAKYFGKIVDQKSLFTSVDEGIISAIDVVDCEGIKALGINEDVPFLGISQIISGYNESSLSEDAAFSNAVDIASSILRNEIRRCSKVIHARQRLECDIKNNTTLPILVMSEFAPGWAQTNIVKESGYSRVVFEAIGGTWRCQIVPDTSLLPESWGGLSGKDLALECGVEDATFCHRGLFIAGASSFAGAMAMAYASLPVIDGTIDAAIAAE